MFTVTFQINASRLEKLMAAAQFISMPDPTIKYNGEAKEAVVTGKKKRRYMGDGAILSLTGKTAQVGSMREKVLEAMELLEKEHGIGTITRGVLKEDLAKKQLDTQVLYQLVREGYLKKV